ncbi:MAG: DUF4149 domain-containing protein [Nitrospirae bacterium]|nr:DUF4149 domain-containing protein [Nitrospirota bacterium]
MMLLLIWVHVLAAVIWVGGMLFLSLVLVPVLKQEPIAAQRGVLFRTIGVRFRSIVWISVAVLAVTGPLLLSQRGDSLLEPSGWSLVLKVKLLLVTALIGLTAIHDFWLGPKVGQSLRELPQDRGPAEVMLIRLSPWIARLALVLALGVLLAATALVRL